MTQDPTTVRLNITREQMIQLLIEDLAGEYQAIIAYTVYSQVLKGAAYTDVARELELHAAEELQHAIKIAKQIDFSTGYGLELGGASRDQNEVFSEMFIATPTAFRTVSIPTGRVSE